MSSPKGKIFLRWLTERRQLYVLGLLALSGGITVRLIAHEEAFRDSVGSFFDAIFIATFCAYTVDPVLKQGLLREGIRNIFSYAYGYSLPLELQEFFEKRIAKASFLRRDCSLHWKIGADASAKDKASVRLHASFNLENFTDIGLTYVHEVFAISDLPGDQGFVETLYCIDLHTGRYKYDLSKDQLIKVMDGKVEKIGYRRGEPISLEPKESERRPSYRVGAHYYSESEMEYGTDQFRILELTTDINVVVTVNQQLRNHSFSIIPPPSSGPDTMLPSLDAETMEYRCYWNIRRVFVPNEVIVIRWRPSS